jgi:hypothetical protein
MADRTIVTDGAAVDPAIIETNACARPYRALKGNTDAKLTRRALSALIAAFAALGAAPAVAQTRTFVFTAIPDQDETRLVERFTKVAEYLGGKLGVPVRYLPVKSYPAA